VVGRVDVETVHGNASVGSVRSVARDTVVGEFAVVVREPIPIDHRDGRRKKESDAGARLLHMPSSTDANTKRSDRCRQPFGACM
jgi:hypothetical protein